MKPAHVLTALCPLALLMTLTGCGGEMYPSYSDEVQYGVRHDPILMQLGKDLGDERYEPDRPGQLPIVKLEDSFKSGHPYLGAVIPRAAEAIVKKNNPELMKKVNGEGKLSREEIEAAGKEYQSLLVGMREKITRDPSAYDDDLKKAFGVVFRDPANISAVDRAAVDKAMEEAFGTPSKPKVAWLDKDLVETLKLDEATLAEGSKRYRVHCLHCHGVPGDGRGPTARWINPHPRDFRQGIFKFQSVSQADGVTRPPHRSDLIRTLSNGIEGTAMPSFRLLEDKDLEYLVSYVMHLSIRGSTELAVIREDFQPEAGGLKFNAGEEGDATPASRVKLFGKITATGWKNAQDPANAIKVAPYPYPENDMDALAKSVERGKYLFVGDNVKHPRGDKANCVSCHTDFGRQARFRFDDWGTLARPNNFTFGVFRGGKRPVDLYYRIHSGINGSGMTRFGAPGNLESQDIWDLVNFVSNLSYPGMRDKLGIKIN